MDWIFAAERQLRLTEECISDVRWIIPKEVKTQTVSPRLLWPRPLSTSWLMLTFYAWLLVGDLAGVLCCLASWLARSYTILKSKPFAPKRLRDIKNAQKPA